VLDRYTLALFAQPVSLLARIFKKHNVSADKVTFVNFFIGLGAMVCLFSHLYTLALLCIIINRIGDGVDGALARMTSPSDEGGFLDIVFDFLFYSSVVLGFAFAEPAQNAPAAALLLFSFMGTASSFLAFAIMAEKRGIASITYPKKGIYYLEGLAEGTETIIFFILFCLFPGSFPLLAYIFAVLCLVTTITRIYWGYLTLKRQQ
jgi:phosphatidylglycerophosphate synthase